jgi:hypothetical protein
MLNFVLGGTYELQAAPSHSPLDTGSQRDAPLQYTVFDPRRFPTLARFADESGILLAPREELFEEGLRLLLEGMRAALRQSK